MPEHSNNLMGLILKKLAENLDKSFTLEELTKSVIPEDRTTFKEADRMSFDRAMQARVLDALLFLEDNNLIILDSLTDESSIRISAVN